MNKHERTHNLIKENVLTILQTKLLSDMTINDICKLSSITRSTFYTHYKDKYHVLECINEEICSQLDNYFSVRFNIHDIEPILINLINRIDRIEFLTMIGIQEGNVNLRQNIQDIIERSANNYFESIHIEKIGEISSHFSRKLFSAIAINFLEYSMKYGEIEQNATFLNRLNHIILENYSKL